MRSWEEIKELKETLERITGFIVDYGGSHYLDDEDFKYACDVADALSWVLGEIDTQMFLGPSYLNLDKLMNIVKKIEREKGVNFDRYK